MKELRSEDFNVESRVKHLTISTDCYKTHEDDGLKTTTSHHEALNLTRNIS
jgi:hypothetical protein